MAGTLIVSNLKTDTDNSFIVRSNTGTTLFVANTTGIDVANSFASSSITSDKILTVANTQISGNIISSQITSVANTQLTGTITGSQISSNTLSNTVFQTGSVENYMNSQNLGFGMRNRIINGAMVIDQRNAGASVTPNSTYTLDRWICPTSQTSKFTVQQNAGAVTPPTGFSNYLGVTSSSSYSVNSTDVFAVRQIIEGFNSADLAWGTASALPITISFWVRSSLTGTFGLGLGNSGFSRAYPATYTINSANTWEYKTVTIAGDTTGTWLTTNGTGIQVSFGLGYGSSYLGTANAWNAGTAFMPTGATSVVGTNGATFYITGVQLEKGSTATSFDYRSYGAELQLCQRYYCRFNANSSGAGLISIGWAVSTTATAFSIAFPVTMRTPPTALEQSGTAANYQIVWAGAANALTSVPTFGGETTVDRTRLEASIASVLTTGMALGIRYASTSAYLAWSAEL